MRRMRRATGLVAATLATSLCLAVVGALAAPGYRAPTTWDLPAEPWEPEPPAEQAITARAVALDIDGTHVTGHLFAPERPVAALVYIHGSGGGNMRAAGERGRALARSGVAVLVTTKVTAGYDPLHRDYSALAEVAATQAAWLRAALGMAPEQVGLYGVSEGGWVAILAAAARPEIAGPLVLDSAPVVTPLEEAAYALTVRGPLAWPPGRRIMSGMLASGRGLLDYLDTDVRPDLPRVRQRVVAVYGVDDRALPVSQAVHDLRAGLPRAPEVLLVPGGHAPPVAGWAGAVGTLLAEPAPGDPGPARTIGTEVPAEALLGAPRPPDPSWLLAPGIHLLLAVVLVTAGRVLVVRRRSSARRAQPDAPTEGDRT